MTFSETNTINSNSPVVATAKVALVQVKWRAIDSEENDGHIIMEGPIKLLRSNTGEGSRRNINTLKLNIANTEQEDPFDEESTTTEKDIPLPTNVKWSITSECHELWDMKGLVVKISFVCPDTKRDVNIQIALPYKNESDKNQAVGFGKALMNANNRTSNSANGGINRRAAPRGTAALISHNKLRSSSPPRSKSPVPRLPSRRQGLPTAA